jgi:hypothetical protein
MNLTTKQRRLIEALLTEATQKEACARAQVSEPSLYRWLRIPAFREALDMARQDLQTQTIQALAQRRAAALVGG